MNEQHLRQLGAEVQALKEELQLRRDNDRNTVNPMPPGRLEQLVNERKMDLYRQHGVDPVAPRYFE